MNIQVIFLQEQQSFFKRNIFRKGKKGRGLNGFIFDWLGNNQHFWMWDYKSIEQELENAGFSNIRRAKFGDSSDLMFSDVEDECRWYNSRGVECQKLS